MNEIENELKKRILEKWKINEGWMKPLEYEAWIDNALDSEYCQEVHISRIESFVGELGGKNLLEVGSGEGGLVIALNLKGVNACGIDISKENVEISKIRARRNSIPSAAFCISDASRLPFEDCTFDVVISNKVLEHIKEQRKVIKEISRVLKEGGLLYVSVPNKWFPNEGHVRMWFPHWMPMIIRKPYLKKFRGEKAAAENYLKDINYLGPKQMRRLVEPYFASCSIKNFEMVQAILSSIDDNAARNFRLMFFMGLTKKLLEYPVLRWLIIQFMERFAPSITMVAKK